MATKSKKASKAKKATASKPQALPKSAISQSAQLINFKIARIFPGIVPKTWFLVVEGTKPYLNMTVRLSPLIYTHRPDYWGIEVIGTLSGIGLPITAPYHVFISLEGIIGTKGIEVIGSTVRRKINIPGQGLVNQP